MGRKVMINGSKALSRLAEYLKKYKYALIIAAVGIVLLLLPTGHSDTAEQIPDSAHSSEFSLEKEELRISKALSSMEGAGETTVILTLRSGVQTLYQTDTSTVRDSSGEYDRREEESETVILSNGSSEQAAVVQEIYPVYEGALVVCQGAGSAEVRLNIVSAVSALTGLPSNRITVVKSE